MSLAGFQVNPIDVNSHFQKSLENLIRIQPTKNLIQKGQGDKSIPPHAI